MTSLADIIDECEHGSTAAFCSACKKSNRHSEKRARMNRRATANGWATVSMLPYPNTQAQYTSQCGAGCGSWIEEGDTVYRADGAWVCEDCASDMAAMGVDTDG